jgi:hypothetical protein
MQKRGAKLIYDPELVVYRRPRSNLKSFARMLMTYGRGRAEQWRLHPSFGSVLNFVPPLFCVYLAVLAVIAFALPAWTGIALLPLALYAFVMAAQGLAILLRNKLTYSLGAIPLIAATHILYGFGFWRGLFTPLRPPGAKAPTTVVLESLAHR